jgi:plasmid stabilization system protein ParE
MPQGDKGKYTDKQKRKAEHIEEGCEDRGVSHREAERRSWATVNKQDHGGKKSGSGRKLLRAKAVAEEHVVAEAGGIDGGLGRGGYIALPCEGSSLNVAELRACSGRANSAFWYDD